MAPNASQLAAQEWGCFQGTPCPQGCDICKQSPTELDIGHLGGIQTSKERKLAMLFLENQNRFNIKSFTRFLQQGPLKTEIGASPMMPYYKTLLLSNSPSTSPDSSIGKFPYFELTLCEDSEDPLRVLGEGVSYRCVGWILMEMVSSRYEKRAQEKLTNEQIVKLLHAGARHSPTVSVVCEFILPLFMMKQRPTKELLSSIATTLLRHPNSPLTCLGWAALGILWWRASDAVPVTLSLSEMAFGVALKKAKTKRMQELLTSCVDLLKNAKDDPTFFVEPSTKNVLGYPCYPSVMISAYRSTIQQEDVEAMKQLVKHTPQWLLEASPYLHLTYLLARIFIADHRLKNELMTNSQSKDSDTLNSLSRGCLYLVHPLRAHLQQQYLNVSNDLHDLIIDNRNREIDALTPRHMRLAMLLRCRVLETLRDTLDHGPSIPAAAEAYHELLEHLKIEPEGEKELTNLLIVLINTLTSLSLDKTQRSGARLTNVIKYAEECLSQLPDLNPEAMLKRYYAEQEASSESIAEGDDAKRTVKELPMREIVGCCLRTQISMARGYFTYAILRDIHKADHCFKMANHATAGQFIEAHLMRIWCLSHADPLTSWDRAICDRKWAGQTLETLISRAPKNSYGRSLLTMTMNAISLLPGATKMASASMLESKKTCKELLATNTQRYDRHLLPQRLLIDATDGIQHLESKLLRQGDFEDARTKKLDFRTQAETQLNAIATSAMLWGRFTFSHIQLINRLLILVGRKEVLRLPIIARTLQQHRRPEADATIESFLTSFAQAVHPKMELPHQPTIQMNFVTLCSLLGAGYDLCKSGPFIKSLVNRRFVFTDKWNSRSRRKSSEFDYPCPVCQLRLLMFNYCISILHQFDEAQIVGDCRGGTEMCLLYQSIISVKEELRSRGPLNASGKLDLSTWPVHHFEHGMQIEVLEDAWKLMK